MSFPDVLDCTPWRLKTPRPLSPFEWTVVFNTVHSEINWARGGVSSTATAAATALVNAIRTQTHCPAWTTSSFGPSPSVAPYAYGCLASWWGSLPLAASQRALFDIAQQGLLCRGVPGTDGVVPWADCPAEKNNLLFRPASQSEYGAQRGISASATTICEHQRNRISYLPLDAPTMVEMIKQLKFDPALIPLVQGLKPFILGIQLRPPGIPNTNPPCGAGIDPVVCHAREMVETVAVITAPGKGIDVTRMALSGNFDPAKLLALIQTLMPDTLNDWLSKLPGLLSTLPGLGTPGGLQIPGWTQFMDNAGQVLGSHVEARMNNPQTGTGTGHPLVDSIHGAATSAVTVAENTLVFVGAALAAALAVVAIGQAQRT